MKPVANIEIRQPDPVPPEPIAVLECPSCGYDDGIREMDEGIRTNRPVSVDPDSQTVTFAIDDWGEWEHKSFLCVNCGTEVDLPEGWEAEYE